MPRHATRRIVVCLSALAVTVTGALTSVTPTQAVESDEDRFFAGVPYTGEFASPQVFAEDGRYYAVATNEDGNNLPAMHSDDLVTWIPRDPLPDYQLYRSWSGFNDAMPKAASWAATKVMDGRRRYSVWAPAIARMGGRYVAAYAAMVNFTKRRLCISLAHADAPEGKYTDSSDEPIVCSSDTHGSIDPDLIKVEGRNYLIWKNSGVKGSVPTRTWIRRLNRSATAFRSGSKAHQLLTTTQSWEGNVTEAPDLVEHDGRFYLFYSGNSYTSRAYATGYAVCESVLGPCTKPTDRPLLATGKKVVGPGGAAGFVDAEGNLVLAFHAWSTSEVGDSTPNICGTCPPRRLHLATLAADDDGLLSVTSVR